MIRFYRRMGFRVEILGEARSHWGRIAIQFSSRPAEWIDDVRSGLRERQPSKVLDDDRSDLSPL